VNGNIAVERRSFGSLKLRGRIWWARYRVAGKEMWESLKTTTRKEAEKRLVVLADRVGRGDHMAPAARRLTFADLERKLMDSYRLKGNRSLDRVEQALAKHLRPAFEGQRASAITTDRIQRYEVDRLAAGASRSTVNYELALLRNAFALAGESNPQLARPTIKTPDPHNARTGFFEPEDFAAVAAELPDDLRAVMTFGYYTGWRVQSEVLPLTWQQVDFRAGVVRLNTNTTKNTEGRVFPFDAMPVLAALLKEQRELTSATELTTGQIISHVFHRNGKPIKSYRHGWHAACQRASVTKGLGGLSVVARPHLEGRIVHDFRRTAVRNLVRAGVPETTAMKLTGHKTRAIFDRYDIQNEADLRAGVAKLATFHGQGSEQAARGTTGGQSGLSLTKAAS